MLSLNLGGREVNEGVFIVIPSLGPRHFQPARYSLFSEAQNNLHPGWTAAKHVLLSLLENGHPDFPTESGHFLPVLTTTLLKFSMCGAGPRSPLPRPPRHHWNHQQPSHKVAVQWYSQTVPTCVCHSLLSLPALPGGSSVQRNYEAAHCSRLCCCPVTQTVHRPVDLEKSLFCKIV